MPSISTTTQLILFFIFTLALNMWSLNTMLLLMLVLGLLLIYLKNNHFYRLMKRLKWFYLVMFLIFVFNTPGQHVANWPFAFMATYEGLEMGLMQVLRIALVLAVLSIILKQNTKQQFISGLYFLMKPLSCLGLDVQRFSARLWLTLHYVELKQASGNEVSVIKGLAGRLEQAFVEGDEDDVVIEFVRPMFTWLDCCAISLMFCFLFIAFLG